MYSNRLSSAVRRTLLCAGAAAASCALWPLAGGAQEGASSYIVPRTAWGDPDLTGKWPGTEMVGVPMQRDESLGTRNVLNDEEFAERVRRAAAPPRSRKPITPTSSSRKPRARRAATSAARCRRRRIGSSAASRSGKRR